MNSPAIPALERDPASWRDASGYVFRHDGRILRAIAPAAVEEFRAFASAPLAGELVERGWMLPLHVLESSEQTALARMLQADVGAIVEQPLHSPWTYPYEWHFEALRDAALRHLDVQLLAFDQGFVLTDASPFNIQFTDAGAAFIDLLSFRRYREGEYWAGHRQFCEQFLCPLLLEARFGVGWQAWFRGALEGISVSDLALLAGWRAWLSPRWAMHVMLPAGLGRRKGPSANGQHPPKLRPLPRPAYRALLDGLRRRIAALEPVQRRTTWDDYAEHNTYASAERAAKLAFIDRFVAQSRPANVLDFGCNTGDFSKAALQAGARHATGFDNDAGALSRAWRRRRDEKAAFLPLYLDAANPSPAQGWNESERSGFRMRFSADALIALAFVHHLAIGRNVPLESVLQWLVSLAPCGVVEFVAPDDPTVLRMLAFRGSAPREYSRAAFEQALWRVATISAREVVTEAGRTLYAYVACAA
jgi:SAM-dependent methyltransferase